MPPKQFKIKTYKPEKHHHYLFFHEPWPHHQNLSQHGDNCCKNIVAWLSIMIEDLCGIEIHPTQVALYYQSTHKNVIADIEIQPSSEFQSPCLDPLLGAHHTTAFLKYGAERPNQITTIYYYDFARFNSPDRTNWSPITTTFPSLAPQFPVKRGGALHPAYPHPQPTDRGQLKLCSRLPGRLILGHPDCVPIPLEPTAPQPNPPGASNADSPSPRARTTSPPPPVERQPTPQRASPPATAPPDPLPRSEFAFAPYESPLHLRRPPNPSQSTSSESDHPSQPPSSKSKMDTKRDPYEEDEHAFAQLHNVETEEEHSVAVKLEDTSVKTEVGTESDPVLFARVMAKVTANSARPPVNGSTSASVPPHRVKDEPDVEAKAAMEHLRVKTEGGEDRVPAQVKREESSVRVKLESHTGFVKEESPPTLTGNIKTESTSTEWNSGVKREEEEKARGGVKSEPHDPNPELMHNYRRVQERLNAHVNMEPLNHWNQGPVKREDERARGGVKSEPHEPQLGRDINPQPNAGVKQEPFHTRGAVKREDGMRGVKLEWPDSGSMLVNEEEEEESKQGVRVKMEMESDPRGLEVKPEPHSNSLSVPIKRHRTSAADFFDTYDDGNRSGSSQGGNREYHDGRDRNDFNTHEPYPNPRENRGDQRYQPPPPASFPSRGGDPRYGAGGFVKREDFGRREPSRTLSPSQRPVKRERDLDEPPPYQRPPEGQPPFRYEPNRDPRMRARYDREQHELERDFKKRAKRE
ncbi:hypothetical protein FB45DRAFT_895224 [Roridomyces roridus]|uniref:Uncharacterized protein n=1 Tax=Roridomyces roridus TaxID=1738132 RepID=A0AAD7CGY4_9AGAR|nr:hypothetical protein FB45DRAFT_895224 [Roridomyces roridus]